jgi:hypothetical protein
VSELVSACVRASQQIAFVVRIVKCVKLFQIKFVTLTRVQFCVM